MKHETLQVALWAHIERKLTRAQAIYNNDRNRALVYIIGYLLGILLHAARKDYDLRDLLTRISLSDVEEG